jgi:hypothetical protein
MNSINHTSDNRNTAEDLWGKYVANNPVGKVCFNNRVQQKLNIGIHFGCFYTVFTYMKVSCA